jgi:hypothetical protein
VDNYPLAGQGRAIGKALEAGWIDTRQGQGEGRRQAYSRAMLRGLVQLSQQGRIKPCPVVPMPVSPMPCTRRGHSPMHSGYIGM